MTGNLRRWISTARIARNRRAHAGRIGNRRVLFGEPLERRDLLAGDAPIITEFMALNHAAAGDETGIVDQFGASSDWIEVFNPTNGPFSMAGWRLTDDAGQLDKWTFPEITMDAGEFLLVFASGTEQLDPTQPLHTNFRLSASGEYLALVRPDGTVAQDFGDPFPEQFTDISFGVGAESGTVLSADMPLSYYVPNPEDNDLSLSGDWSAIDFDDSAWKTSPTSVTEGVGFAIGDSAAILDGQFSTNVEGDMWANNGSLWIRQEFDVTDPDEFDGLLLNIQWDDGFVAYLNGTKVAERNPPTELTYNAEAEVPRRPRRDVEDALGPDLVDIGRFTNQIVPGTNVLGIHVLNDTSFDAEVLSRATLTRITVSAEISPDRIGYLAEQTPASANRQLRGGTVEFSETAKLFTEPFELSMTSSIPGQTIRYSTEDPEVTAASPVYTGPIQVTESSQIWAVAFAADGTPGPRSSASFTELNADVTGFSSDLPIVVIEGFGTRPASSGFRGSFITVIEPDPETGRTSLTGEPTLETRAGLRIRGSSTSGNPKLNMAVEFWDDLDQDKDQPILGMPADSDWVFYAPYNFDRTAGVRNSFFYELGNQMGIYSTRTRFAEVYHNLDGDDLERSDLTGIYVMIEKIKVGEDRVDIQTLTPEDTEEPEVTGGWLFKIDRADPGDSGIGVGSRTILFVEPKETEVEAVPEQLAWVRGYLNDLTRTIADRDTTWEEITEVIDVHSWVNNAIVNNVGWNVDVFRLSGYFHKDRNGPMVQGPLWDCDRCMGSEDGRDTNPEVWTSALFNFDLWWDDLVRNQPDFMQAYIDRWFEQRNDTLSTGNVRSIVDTFASQVAEAQVRNFQRWPQVRPNSNNRFDPEPDNTWESEVRHLKGWLTTRLEWTDSRFVAPAVMEPAGGRFDKDKPIVLSAESGSIYYTLDGTDPRRSGGDVSPSAILYEGPFTLSEPATIKYRVKDDTVTINVMPRNSGGKDGSPWSAPQSATFAEQAPASAANLRITEINYNPPEATPQELAALGVETLNNDEFEFVEVANISDDPINLGGAQLVRVAAFDDQQGIDFTFADQMLAPGERIVVVENVDAFRARFGAEVRVAQGSTGAVDATDGQYGGLLDNGGENIKINDRFGQLLQRVTYDDAGDWPTQADGNGSSLELIDVRGDPSDPAHWRSSLEFGGSPGRTGDELADRIVISEIVSNTDGPEGDAIELFNASREAIDITGWSISNDDEDLFKFTIQPPTIIPAGGYLVFHQPQLGFGLDEARGGNLFILETDTSGKPIRFAHRATFGNTAPNVSLGRWPDISGEFWPMAETTLGSANSGIRPGDVIISEVHYSPIDPDGDGRQDADDFEYIELFNQTGTDVDLSDWLLTGDGVEFQFPSGTSIGSGQTLILVPFDPASSPTDVTIFQFFYGTPVDARFTGDFRESRRTSLEDTGGHLLLQKPGTPPDDDRQLVPLYWVDELTYDDEAPWPTDVMGNGNSLTRVSARQPGFNPSNWTAAPTSPGMAEFTTRIVGDANGDGMFGQSDLDQMLQSGKYLTRNAASFEDGDFTGDGLFNQLDIIAALRNATFRRGQVPP